MDITSSIYIVQTYAKDQGLRISEALAELDHLASEDWIYTSPGAPKGYQRKTTLAQDEAVTTFCKNRARWRSQAVLAGLDLSDWT